MCKFFKENGRFSLFLWVRSRESASSAGADYAVAVFPVPSSCCALRRAKRVRLTAPPQLRQRLGTVKKSEVAFGEGVTGTGLQVRLEGDSLIFRLESEVSLDFPRFEFCGVWHFSRVVFLQPLPQIRRMTNISLSRMFDAAENVGVEHGRGLKVFEIPPEKRGDAII